MTCVRACALRFARDCLCDGNVLFVRGVFCVFSFFMCLCVLMCVCVCCFFFFVVSMFVSVSVGVVCRVSL